MIYRIFGCRKVHRAEKILRQSDSTISSGEGKCDVPSAQTLLAALRNLIVPLVQTVIPDINDTTEGPEAELLLVALQNYVASIIGCPNQHNNHVPGTLTRIVPLEVLDASDTPSKKKLISDNTEVEKLPDVEITKTSLISSHNAIHGQDGELRIILSDLQERVFNRLPIRLLSFEKSEESKYLKISLISRTQIYSMVAKKLAAKYIQMLWDDEGRLSLVYDVTEYAILSHTWLRSDPGEITYEDWRNGTFNVVHPGYRKLAHFSRSALEDHNTTLGWMDTVCIDKSSSSELDESIRSMYKWYRSASICITYLAESVSIADMANDPWFTRGWTLQELLAPRTVKFYDRNWNALTTSDNDKTHDGVLEQIKVATSITREELLKDILSGLPISRRMQWAANRHVTRGEDTAYSLMGIFSISMSIAYGEGADVAFARLVKEIINTTKYRVLDVFNWGGTFPTKFSLLLPSSPQAYLQRNANLKELPERPMEPLMLTALGLRVPVLIFPTTLTDTPGEAYTPKGNFFSAGSSHHAEGVKLPLITIKKVSLILDVNAFNSSIPRDQRRYAFVVLNCTGDEHIINVPVQCFAIAIGYFNTDAFITPLTRRQKVFSDKPIVFQIRNNLTTGPYSMRPSELGRHGIQYLSMYC
ncbi:hypothetical protein BDN70DRAFT_998376 [Pholiota conissans]|uniref:Heterokaryon incompatibility domain-containing protein n=1 Tax=Pholiota conissans TaxID=109636 RepID=A0A9P5YMG2_9AGAR|nr:hypothetical protein BDN70DRAFT_998376 [Pholiota conissans]